MTLRDKINQIKQFTDVADQTIDQKLKVCSEELDEANEALYWLEEEFTDQDRIKEICDVLFTILPLLDHYCTDPDAAFNRVVHSNLTKLWDQGSGRLAMVKDANGKVVKGPNYQKPNFDDILAVNKGVK